MSKQTTNYDKTGINDQLAMIADQMCVLFDEAMNLQIACGWYDEDDSQYGGPPSKDQLIASTMRLKAAYMKVALLTGLDPCEQLPSTKDRLKQQKSRHTGHDLGLNILLR